MSKLFCNAVIFEDWYSQMVFTAVVMLKMNPLGGSSTGPACA